MIRKSCIEALKVPSLDNTGTLLFAILARVKITVDTQIQGQCT